MGWTESSGAQKGLKADPDTAYATQNKVLIAMSNLGEEFQKQKRKAWGCKAAGFNSAPFTVLKADG